MMRTFLVYHIGLLISIIAVNNFLGLAYAFAPRSAITKSECCWKRTTVFAYLDNNNNNNNSLEDDATNQEENTLNRRTFFHHVQSFASIIIAAATVNVNNAAHAVGLVFFPCTTPLHNEYHMMRSGTTLLEEVDIWSTNPMFLTNREAALSDKGIAQVQAACQILIDANINPSVMKYSLAASAMDTVGIVRDELKVGQNRVVPEFTFMDPRAIGRWDMMSYSQTLPAVMAMDEAEAGPSGSGGRPPPNDDGTPHETLADQAIRLRQLMSVLETQYSGDTILLVFPDGTGPAVLSAMMAGIPLNKAHELEFAPGELRLDVTYQSALDLYSAKIAQPETGYMTTEVRTTGEQELKRLRSLDNDKIVSRKDMFMEQERLEIDEKQRQMEQARFDRGEQEKEARMQRQREMEAGRRGQRGDATSNDDGGGGSSMMVPIIGGGAVAAIAALALGGRKANDEPQPNGDAELKANEPGGSNGAAIEEERVQSFEMKDASFEETIQEAKQASLYGKPAPTEEDRRQAAATAMQDYLDSDDGGDDWLKVMQDLVHEDDENDLFGIDELSNQVNGHNDAQGPSVES